MLSHIIFSTICLIRNEIQLFTWVWAIRFPSLWIACLLKSYDHLFVYQVEVRKCFPCPSRCTHNFTVLHVPRAARSSPILWLQPMGSIGGMQQGEVGVLSSPLLSLQSHSRPLRSLAQDHSSWQGALSNNSFHFWVSFPFLHVFADTDG